MTLIRLRLLLPRKVSPVFLSTEVVFPAHLFLYDHLGGVRVTFFTSIDLWVGSLFFPLPPGFSFFQNRPRSGEGADLNRITLRVPFMGWSRLLFLLPTSVSLAMSPPIENLYAPSSVFFLLPNLPRVLSIVFLFPVRWTCFPHLSREAEK